MRSLCITLPSTVKWEDYQKELDAVKDYRAVISFKVPFLPKEKCEKCYLCYKGNVIGWMKVVGYAKDDFVCDVTGKHFSGYFIKRSGPFNKIEPIPMKGFRGFKYVDFDD